MQVAATKKGNERCELEEAEESNPYRRSNSKLKLSLETHSKRYPLMKSLLSVKCLSCSSTHSLKEYSL